MRSFLLVLALLATPTLAQAAKDKDEMQRDFARFLARQFAWQHMQHNVVAAQQLAAMNAMQANQYAQLLRSGYFTPSIGPVDWRNQPKVEELRVVKDNIPFSFREQPGERELRLGRLWSGVDKDKARSLYQLAVQRCGNSGPIAAQAKKEMDALEQ
jgi:hypothetical protein